MAATRNGHLQIVKYLVKHGLSIYDANNNKETALDLAKKYGHKEILEFFKENDSSSDSIKKRKKN